MSERRARNCRDLGPLFGRATDGEATPDEALQIAHHLADCTACRIILAKERRLAAILERGMADPIEVDESFVDELMARLPQGPPPRRQRRTKHRNLKLASVGGLLVLFAWLIFSAALMSDVGATGWDFPLGSLRPIAADFPGTQHR